MTQVQALHWGLSVELQLKNNKECNFICRKILKMLCFLTESKHRNVSLRTNQHSLRILSPAQLSLNSQGLIFKLFYQKYFEWKFSDEKFSPRCHPLSYPGYVVQGSTKQKVKQTKLKVKQTKQNQIKPTQTKQNQIKCVKILVWQFFPQECGPGSRDFVKRCLTKKKETLSHHQIISGTRAGLGNLQRIYWRAKPHEAVDAYPETNFVLGHEQWVPKEWVLKVFFFCSRWSSTLSKVETLI